MDILQFVHEETHLSVIGEVFNVLVSRKLLPPPSSRLMQIRSYESR